jgi:hypothetical protein
MMSAAVAEHDPCLPPVTERVLDAAPARCDDFSSVADLKG